MTVAGARLACSGRASPLPSRGGILPPETSEG